VQTTMPSVGYRLRHFRRSHSCLHCCISLHGQHTIQTAAQMHVHHHHADREALHRHREVCEREQGRRPRLCKDSCLLAPDSMSPWEIPHGNPTACRQHSVVHPMSPARPPDTKVWSNRKQAVRISDKDVKPYRRDTADTAWQYRHPKAIYSRYLGLDKPRTGVFGAPA
jgi:hypothetical protein